jgi:predicted nucleotide-binding protein
LYNLLVSGNGEAWDSPAYEYERSRYTEHTAKEIKEKFQDLDEATIEKLKSYPTLFVYENGHDKPARIGWVTRIKLKQNSIVIEFEFEPTFEPLTNEQLKNLRLLLDIDEWEFNRTHWAIKDEDLFNVLEKNNLIEQSSVEAISKRVTSSSIPKHDVNSNQIFIVHGHDEAAKVSMARFISELGFKPIILHEQPNSGRTIIEKIEAYSNVGFGVVLYTPCDIGSKKGEAALNKRARQNVVFEHGFLIGKLGRPRVSAFVKEDIETPNDISGVVYTNLDSAGAWKVQLAKELQAAGYKVDMNKIV